MILILCCFYFQADRNPAFVKVSRADVDQLVTEIMQVKEFLPKVSFYSFCFDLEFLLLNKFIGLVKIFKLFAKSFLQK